MTLGVIIARFQVPELTLGHKYLIGSTLARFDKIGFILGESDKRDSRNPLTFSMREQMLRRFLWEHPPLFIKAVTDLPGLDKSWSKWVDFHLDKYRLEDYMDITLVGGRDSFIPHYTGTLKTLEIEPIPQAALFMISGTETRDKIDVIDSPDFRAGVIWQVRNGN